MTSPRSTWNGSMPRWHRSAAYRQILALRTANSLSDFIVVDGVGSGHRATDVPTHARKPSPPPSRP
jgi:hypothetical protein